MAAKLLLVAALIHASAAFFYPRDTPTVQSEGRPIEESCLNHATAGSCEFYSCFERRLPCGRQWYMLKHGHYYCNRMVSNKNRFTPAGQEFLNATQRCLTSRLRELYRLESIDCHDLEHEAVEDIAECLTSNGFCDILQNEAEEFFQIYEFSDLFTRGATKLWRALLRIATTCGAQYARQFTSDTSETVLGAINSFFSSISSLGSRK